MTDEGHNILLAKDANAITFKKGDIERTIYTKVPSFNPTELMEIVKWWHPRINITPKVLASPEMLAKYDAAGALTTNLAKLGTAGVNYEIYSVDKDGNMVKPARETAAPVPPKSDSEYRDTSRTEVRYLYGAPYLYNANDNTYTRNGVVVTDSNLIKELDYARRIIGLSPVKQDSNWDYYILFEGEKSEVIKQDNGESKKIKEVQGDEAQKLIREIEEQKAAAAREAAIQEKLAEDNDNSPATKVNEETGEITIVGEKREPKPVTSAKPAAQDNNQKFSRVIRSKKGSKIMDAVKRKIVEDSSWADAPTNSYKALEEYLRRKGAQLDMIPSDAAGLEAWIHNNIECK